jgi:predicted Zn-dependent peptidase
MKDRLIFKTAKLKNGIRIFAKSMDVPFAYVWLYVPVGHIHNTGSVLPGTAHLLEHIA